MVTKHLYGNLFRYSIAYLPILPFSALSAYVTDLLYVCISVQCIYRTEQTAAIRVNPRIEHRVKGSAFVLVKIGSELRRDVL